jgi:hypothetical protein
VAVENEDSVGFALNGKYELQKQKDHKSQGRSRRKNKMPTMEIPAGTSPPLNMCAQCNATGVPLLACDDPDVATKVPASSKSRYVYS